MFFLELSRTMVSPEVVILSPSDMCLQAVFWLLWRKGEVSAGI